MSGRRLEPEIIGGIPPTNSVLLLMSTVQQCTGVRGVEFHSVSMLCHLWCPTAGCTVVSHCWLHRSQFSLRSNSTFHPAPLSPGSSTASAQSVGGTAGANTCGWKVQRRRTSCRHITAPHCLPLTSPTPLTMIDRPVGFPLGFSHIRGGEPVNLVMTEQVASHAG